MSWELGMARTMDASVMQLRYGGRIEERLGGMLALALLSAANFGGLLKVASWGAGTRREQFVRFHAGVVLGWWSMMTNSMRFRVGGPKQAWLQLSFLDPTRNICDVAVHVACVSLLLMTLFGAGRGRGLLGALAACLAYLAVFDTLFVGDYYVAPIVLSLFWCCLPAARGGLAGLQLQMIVLMVGAGLSKVGPHFDRPTMAHLARIFGSVAPPWMSNLLWQGALDHRPSWLASNIAAATILAEICVPVFLFSSSRAVVKRTVCMLLAMHAVMALSAVVLTFMEMWMSMMWCYLFLGGHREGPSHGFDYRGWKAMPRAVKAGFCLFLLANGCAHLQPAMDWHPLLKFSHFASGNQPVTNPILVRKAAMAKLRARVPVPEGPWDLSRGSQLATHILTERWFVELNHRPSAALLDCAFLLAGGGNASDYFVTLAEPFVQAVAGGDSSSMNNYDLHLFKSLARMGVFDDGDAMLVWMEPVAWPQLPLGRQVMTWGIWDGRRGLVRAGELTSAQLRSLQRPSSAAGMLPPDCQASSPP